MKRPLYSYDCNANPLHPIDCMINFYSDRVRLLKDVVWLLKIRAKRMLHLSSDMEVTDILIIRYVQM